MLTPNSYRQYRLAASKQKGVVLLITLIMLVAMTLAAIALMRSVDTTNVIAGNLAFQQTSFHIADAGTEEAIDFLYSATMVGKLDCNGTGVGEACPQGYKSWHEPGLEPPATGRTWEAFWNSMIAGPGVVPLTNLPNGYTGAFVIEAMCDDPEKENCTTATTSTNVTTPQGQDMGSQSRAFTNTTITSNVIFYRITTRVEGPRNSVGFVQAMIAL